MVQRTRRYLIRRVVVVLLTLFVVTLLSFLLMRLSPIDPATAYVKRNSAIVTQEQIDEARVMLGLDKPLPVQYFDWVVDALHMDFGISLGTGNPVTEELAKTVPVTLTVVAYSAVIMSLGVLGVGMLGYLWRQKAGGMILSFLTMIGISVPGFYLGTAFIDLFAVRLGWISVSGNSGLPLLPVRSACRSWGSASMGRCWRPLWNEKWSRTMPCTCGAAGCGRVASFCSMPFPTPWWTSYPASPRCWGCALPMRPLWSGCSPCLGWAT